MNEGMKNFERVIQSYLDGRAKEDGRLAERMALPEKSIGECCKYIIGEVSKMKSREVALTDEEVYGMAVHYYDEDNVDVKASRSCRVVSPADMREDKPEGRKSKAEAVEERDKPKGRKAKVAARMDERQLSLFD